MSRHIILTISLRNKNTASSSLEVNRGGKWAPDWLWCTARHRIVIIIPFRKREEHLSVFLQVVHRILRKQLADYRIVVVEQADALGFNRAFLLNIGAREATERFDGYYDCLILHDVDQMPLNDNVAYHCQSNPMQLSVYMEGFNYTFAPWWR